MVHQTLTNLSVTTGAISKNLFGADMLRFRRTENFEVAADEAGVARIRWPGEGIVDPRATDTRWIKEFDADGNPSEYVYDLTHDNIIDTTGWPRDGLREALEYAVSANMGFSMLVPEERYILVDLEAADGAAIFAVDFGRVEADLTVFLDRLLDGHFGTMPSDFTLQLGQEYYTGPLADLVSSEALDHRARVEATGALYNFMAGFIKDHVAERTANGQNAQNLELDVAIQLGRFLRHPDGDPAFGSSDDAAVLASQFDATGLSAVDELLFQRYAPRFEGVADGLSSGPEGQSLEAALKVWSDRISDLGLAHEPEVTAGWAKSAYTRSEAQEDYTGTVSQLAFENRTDEDFERYYQTRLNATHDLGEKLPSMILEFVDELVAAGVDNGFYYGFDTQFVGALTRTDVDGTPVTLLGGTVFAWLVDELVGKERIGHSLEATRQQNSVNIYAYSGEQELSVFLASNNLNDEQLDHQLEIGHLIQKFGPLRLNAAKSLTAEIPHDWTTRFGVADLNAQFGPGFQDAEAQAYATARFDENGKLPNAISELSGGVLATTFRQDFEVVGLNFSRGQGYNFSDLKLVVIADSENSRQTEDNAELVIANSTEGNIDAGAGADVIFGSSQSDILRLGKGEDRVFGSHGGDYIDGGEGSDTVDYWTSTVGLLADLQFPLLNLGLAAGDTYVSVEGVIGSGFSDNLRGDRAENNLRGGDGNDVLHGRSGDDRLFGQAGNDVLLGGAGADTIDGGAGVDRVAYWTDTNAVLVDLLFEDQNSGGALADRFISIEDIQGTSLNDDLRGDHGRNRVWAGDGADILHGRNGDDVLRGQNGDDIIIGGVGADIINGGAGIDRAAYWTARTAVSVNLADVSHNTGEAHGDVFVGIEDLQGSNFNDVLSGDSRDNRIWGGAGNDTIYGGDGADLLFGQDGADVFVFELEHMGWDRVHDFETGQDRLDISAWDTNGFDSLTLTALDAGVLVHFQGNVIGLDNIVPMELSAESFLF